MEGANSIMSNIGGCRVGSRNLGWGEELDPQKEGTRPPEQK